MYTASPSGSGKRVRVSDILGLDAFESYDESERKEERSRVLVKRSKKEGSYHENNIEEPDEDESGFDFFFHSF